MENAESAKDLGEKQTIFRAGLGLGAGGSGQAGFAFISFVLLDKDTLIDIQLCGPVRHAHFFSMDLFLWIRFANM